MCIREHEKCQKEENVNENLKPVVTHTFCGFKTETAHFRLKQQIYFHIAKKKT